MQDGRKNLCSPAQAPPIEAPARSPAPRLLSPKEFAARLLRRIRSRYDPNLDDARLRRWLHDLIKDALLFGATRHGNDGLRPVYGYDFRSYRRALQIARLRGVGIVERDAIRVQLFLRGYGEKDIRQAVWNQYSKNGRSLLAQVRSGYVDNAKEIPPIHKASLVEALGELDSRLGDAGLQLPNDYYIASLRTAKQAQTNWNAVDQKSINKIRRLRETLFEAIASAVVPCFAGLLMFSSKDDREAAGRDPVEEHIFAASPEEFEQARDAYSVFTNPAVIQLIMNFIVGTKIGPNSAAIAITFSIRNDPRWAAATLVCMLMCVRLFPVRFTADQVLAGFRWARDEQLSFADIVQLAAADPRN